MNIQRLTFSSTMPVYRFTFDDNEEIDLNKAVDQAESFNFGYKLAKHHLEGARQIDVLIYVD